MYKMKTGSSNGIVSTGISLRDQINSQVKKLQESCLRIGSLQDNLIAIMRTSISAASPTVIESSYSLMDMERNRVRSVLYSLLVAINMPDEAALLMKYWSESKDMAA